MTMIAKWTFDNRGKFYCTACKKYPEQTTCKVICPNCGSQMSKFIEQTITSED